MLRKRLAAILLSLAMVATMMPSLALTAWAEETDENDTKSICVSQSESASTALYMFNGTTEEVLRELQNDTVFAKNPIEVKSGNSQIYFRIEYLSEGNDFDSVSFYFYTMDNNGECTLAGDDIVSSYNVYPVQGKNENDEYTISTVAKFDEDENGYILENGHSYNNATDGDPNYIVEVNVAGNYTGNLYAFGHPNYKSKSESDEGTEDDADGTIDKPYRIYASDEPTCSVPLEDLNKGDIYFAACTDDITRNDISVTAHYEYIDSNEEKIHVVDEDLLSVKDLIDLDVRANVDEENKKYLLGDEAWIDEWILGTDKDSNGGTYVYTYNEQNKFMHYGSAEVLIKCNNIADYITDTESYEEYSDKNEFSCSLIVTVAYNSDFNNIISSDSAPDNDDFDNGSYDEIQDNLTYAKRTIRRLDTDTYNFGDLSLDSGTNTTYDMDANTLYYFANVNEHSMYDLIDCSVTESENIAARLGYDAYFCKESETGREFLYSYKDGDGVGYFWSPDILNRDEDGYVEIEDVEENSKTSKIPEGNYYIAYYADYACNYVDISNSNKLVCYQVHKEHVGDRKVKISYSDETLDEDTKKDIANLMSESADEVALELTDLYSINYFINSIAESEKNSFTCDNPESLFAGNNSNKYYKLIHGLSSNENEDEETNINIPGLNLKATFTNGKFDRLCETKTVSFRYSVGDNVYGMKETDNVLMSNVLYVPYDTEVDNYVNVAQDRVNTYLENSEYHVEITGISVDDMENELALYRMEDGEVGYLSKCDDDEWCICPDEDGMNQYFSIAAANIMSSDPSITSEAAIWDDEQQEEMFAEIIPIYNLNYYDDTNGDGAYDENEYIGSRNFIITKTAEGEEPDTLDSVAASFSTSDKNKLRDENNKDSADSVTVTANTAVIPFDTYGDISIVNSIKEGATLDITPESAFGSHETVSGGASGYSMNVTVVNPTVDGYQIGVGDKFKIYDVKNKEYLESKVIAQAGTGANKDDVIVSFDVEHFSKYRLVNYAKADDESTAEPTEPEIPKGVSFYQYMTEKMVTGEDDANDSIYHWYYQNYSLGITPTRCDGTNEKNDYSFIDKIDSDDNIEIYGDPEAAFNSLEENSEGRIDFEYLKINTSPGNSDVEIPNCLNMTMLEIEYDADQDDTETYTYTDTEDELMYLFCYGGSIKLKGDVSNLDLTGGIELPDDYTEDDVEETGSHYGNIDIDGDVGNAVWIRKTRDISEEDQSKNTIPGYLKYYEGYYEKEDILKSVNASELNRYFDGTFTLDGTLESLAVKELLYDDRNYGENNVLTPTVVKERVKNYLADNEELTSSINAATNYVATSKDVELIPSRKHTIYSTQEWYDNYVEKLTYIVQIYYDSNLPCADNTGDEGETSEGEPVNTNNNNEEVGYHWDKQYFSGEDELNVMESYEGIPEKDIIEDAKYVDVYGTNNKGITLGSKTNPIAIKQLGAYCGIINVYGDVDYLDVQDLVKYQDLPGKIDVSISGDVEDVSIWGASSDVSIAVDGEVGHGSASATYNPRYGSMDWCSFKKIGNAGEEILINGNFASGIKLYDSDDEDCEMGYSVNTSISDLEDALIESTEEEISASESAKCIKVGTSLKPEELDASDKAAVMDGIGDVYDGYTVGDTAAEICVSKYSISSDGEVLDSEAVTDISDKNAEIEYTVDIANYNSNNVYEVVRIHDEQVEDVEGGVNTTTTYDVINSIVDEKAGTITFKSDKFSEFVFIESTETPSDDLEDNADIDYSASLSLDNNIDVNFYISIPIGTGVNKSKFRVESTFLDKKTTSTLYDAEMLEGAEDGYTDYKLVVASARSNQMTEPVIIDVYYGTKLVKKIDYSVKQYCRNKLSDEDSDDGLKALCKAVLNYGTEAQKYFAGMKYSDGTIDKTYEDSDYANNGLTTTLNSPIKPVNAAKLTNTDSLLESASASLILGSDVSIKVYFKYEDDCEIGTVKCYKYDAERADGQGVEVDITEPVYDESKGRYSVQIKGLTSRQLDDEYIFAISDGTTDSSKQATIRYSAYAYAANKWDSETVGALCKSLVNYGNYAETYFSE